MSLGSKPEQEKPLYRKTSIFFTRDEFILRVRVTGQKYLHSIHLETNHKQYYSCGNRKKNDFECEFDINEGDKVVAFTGVCEVMFNECRFLNLSVVVKKEY
jgi:hypothetical protein